MHQEGTSKQSTQFCSQRYLAGRKPALLTGLSSTPEQEPASPSPARAAENMIHGNTVIDITVCITIVCITTLQYCILVCIVATSLHSFKLLSMKHKIRFRLTLIAGMGVAKCMLASSSCRCCSTVDLGTRICICLMMLGTTLANTLDMVFRISCDVPSIWDWRSCLGASVSESR